MHAHLVQFDIAWEDRAANHGRVREMLGAAPLERGDLIVLPELFDVGFSLDLDAAIDARGQTLEYLTELARDTGCTVHGGRAVADPDEPGKARNEAVVVSPDHDDPVCVYHKIHPFSYGREPESYNGGAALTHYDWVSGDASLRVCPAVCYDLRFPELFRAGARAGAEAFVLGANWPDPRQAHWRALAIARAIENQAWVIAVNRCGDDPHLSYAGGSIVVDPKGQVAGELGTEEAVLSTGIDPDLVRSWRETFPCLADIRIFEI